ncbi:MAG: PAS domain-containing sensor histidine kinase [Opitutaceae bacterium]
MTYGAERLASLYELQAGDLKQDATLLFQHIHPEDRSRVERASATSRQEMTPWHEEFRIQTHTLGTIWLDCGAVPRLKDNGNVIWHCALTNITPRKVAEAALQESRAQLMTTFNHLSEGVVVCKLDGSMARWNPAAVRMHGFANENEIPVEFSTYPELFELTTLDGRVVPFESWPLARILRGESVHDLELRIRHRIQGWKKVFNYGGALAHDADSRPLLAIVHISDFTRRREAEEEVNRLNAQLEERVAARTAELENANRELEAFSYSVSHDLRSPLRTVDGFAQALIEDCGDDLSEDGRRYLRTIREGAQRMGMLIDDLLTFSRLGRLSIKRRPLDTRKIVEASLEPLQTEQQERNIEVAIGPLPASQADPALLRQVWSNLLSNAFKYTRTRERARIEIGCARVDGSDVFFVRDNGVGFDPCYAHKIFKVFERLHRDEEFEGTGVGLAIVHRIVTRHGGKVWADATPDSGATFSFTLASPEPHERKHSGRNTAR